jgi:MGT family glycosyltransferase
LRRAGGKLTLHEYGYKLSVPELALTPPEFDFPQNLERSRRCYVGACVHLERHDVSFPWDRLEADKPLVYCSLGTYNQHYPAAEQLFRTVVEALGQRRDLQLVVQVGDTIEPAALSESAPNVVAVKEAPQLEILERASLMITHGGFSSVREALFFGVPMIVLPCWYDQPGNAARVVYHRLGLRADIEDIDARQMAAAVRRITRDGTFQETAKLWRTRFRAQQRCEAGVDFIVDFLRSTAPRATTAHD